MDTLSIFNARLISDKLYGHAKPLQVEVVAQTGSTNADLMARVETLTSPVALIAEHQTAGKGRAGRVWHSVAGEVLTFSLAWHFPCKAQQLQGLSLAAGVAVAECLLDLALPVRLKWPNDILKDQKKLAGMLIETAPSKQQGSWVILGIGMNLRANDQLEQEIGHVVADAPWLAQMDRNTLMAHLLNRVCSAMQEFSEFGFAHFVTRWNALDAFAQEHVYILEAGQIKQQGKSLGVDATACLLLETSQGVCRILAGDVSLRNKLE